MLHIDKERCPQSHRCPMIPQCPTDAITQVGNGLPVIDPQRCIECGICIKICAMGAVYKD